MDDLKGFMVGIIGAGLAGSAIANACAELGCDVALLNSNQRHVSSLYNQCIQHSGFVYHEHRLMNALFTARSRSHPLVEKHVLNDKGALFLHEEEEALEEHFVRLTCEGLRAVRIDAAQLETMFRKYALDVRGFVGGIVGPDRVVDFPGVQSDLRDEAERKGARILDGVEVERLERRGDRITGVHVRRECDGERWKIEAKYYITATGGYTPELLAGIDVYLPIKRWRSYVVTVPDEIVPQIVNTMSDPFLTVVPFKTGMCTVSDARRFPVVSGGDTAVVPAQVEALKADIHRRFPRLNLEKSIVHGCIKCESAGTQRRDHNAQVFAPLDNLLVCLPGKASLALELSMQAVVRMLWNASRDAA